MNEWLRDSILKTIFAHVGDESGQLPYLIVSELKDEQAVASQQISFAQ